MLLGMLECVTGSMGVCGCVCVCVCVCGRAWEFVTASVGMCG